MADTFQQRAAEALMEDELTTPTLEDLFIRTMLLLKCVQSPRLASTLSSELSRKYEQYLTELLNDYTGLLQEDVTVGAAHPAE